MPAAATFHHVAPTPQTVRWGLFDASFPPVAQLPIPATSWCSNACPAGRSRSPPRAGPSPSRSGCSPSTAATCRASARTSSPARSRCAAAEPGDCLRVTVEKIELGADWGYCGFRPLVGTLPEDFPTGGVLHIPATAPSAPARCRLDRA